MTSDQQRVEDLLDSIQSELLTHAKASMLEGTTVPAPVAVLLGKNESNVVAISMLDLSQRIPVLQKAVTLYNGVGFILLHDGFTSVVDNTGVREQRDALLVVQMTAWSGKATAFPYRRTQFAGCAFDQPMEAREVPAEYCQIKF